jgi:hypothetical protein
MSRPDYPARLGLDRIPGLDHLVRQGLYRGGYGDKVGTLRGLQGWEELPCEVDVPDVPVTGSLPDWLSGTLLRTGPGKWDLGHGQLEHWWDGLALLQRFTFQAGRVSYRCRFLDRSSAPLLPIVEVGDLQETIDFINDRAKPLALYAFTGTQETRRRLAAETSSGGLVFGLPVAQLRVPELPFGGVGESGMDSYYGPSIAAFSHRKAVLDVSATS